MTRNIPQELEDCYEILGLRPGASIEEIKKGFRKVSKDGTHPDSGGTAAQFRVVQKCYEKLMIYVAQQSSSSSSSKSPRGNNSPKSPGWHSSSFSFYPQSLQFEATSDLYVCSVKKVTNYGKKLKKLLKFIDLAQLITWVNSVLRNWKAGGK
jgi:curved DNA-binding protein CbpA